MTRSGKDYVYQAKFAGREGRANGNMGQKVRTKRKEVPTVVATPTTTRSAAAAAREEQETSKAAVLSELKRTPVKKKIRRSTPRRVTRNTKPRCTLYGKDRATLYKHFFFCMNCVYLDQAGDSSRINPDSETFRCRAKHQSSFFPTERLYEAEKRKKRKKQQRRTITPSKSSSAHIENSIEEYTVDSPYNSDDEPSINSQHPEQDSSTDESSLQPAALDLHSLSDRMEEECNNNNNNNQQQPTTTTETPIEMEINFPNIPNIPAADRDDRDDEQRMCLLKDKFDRELERLRAEIWTQSKQITALRRKLNTQHRQNNRLTHDSTPRTADKLAVLIGDYARKKLDTLIKPMTLAQSIVDTVWNLDLMDGLYKEVLLKRVRKHLRKNVFQPWKVLKYMDLSGGKLSMEGLAVLRQCEHGGRKYSKGGILPCSSDIKRAGASLEKLAHRQLPFEIGQLSRGGETIEFDPKNLLPLLFKAYKLDEVAKNRSVTLAQSIDGARLTANLKHVTYGVKINDKAAICPLSRKPLFAVADMDASTLQSRNNVYPIKIVLASEDAKLLQEDFKKQFEFFNPLTEGGVCDVPALIGGGNTLLGTGGEDADEEQDDFCHPLNVAVNADMSAVWKLMKRGGAAKCAKYPCHCCGISSAELAQPNAVPCGRCQANHADKPGWRCHHWNFLSNDYIEKKAEELEVVRAQLLEVQLDVESLEKTSKIRMDEDPRVTMTASERDPASIFFKFNEASTQERLAYSAKIVFDLQLRELEITGSLAGRQKRLQDSLIVEYSFKRLTETVKHGKMGTDEALIQLINALPCILHMENRVGLKVLTRLLSIGLDNAKGKLTFLDTAAEGARVTEFLAKVAEVCNKEVWGSPTCPTHWQVPYDSNKKELGTLCMDNNKARAAVNSLERLIVVCLPVESGDLWNSREAWISCIGEYRSAMKMLRRKADFTDADIELTQLHCDVFFQEWVDMHGVEGVTNYIHMIGAGHLSDYLFHWRNLFQHSQQGWEAFNSLLKCFYFRRTARGGGKGDKSRLKPIGRWLQRRIFWMLGYSDRDFDSNTVVVRTEEQEDDDEEFFAIL